MNIYASNPHTRQNFISVQFVLYALTFQCVMPQKCAFFVWISNISCPMAKAVSCLISSMWLYDFWEHLVCQTRAAECPLQVPGVCCSLSFPENFILACGVSVFHFTSPSNNFILFYSTLFNRHFSGFDSVSFEKTFNEPIKSCIKNKHTQ